MRNTAGIVFQIAVVTTLAVCSHANAADSVLKFSSGIVHQQGDRQWWDEQSAVSSTDAANVATIKLIGDEPADANSADLDVLCDGKLPAHSDDPRRNFFLNGQGKGAITFAFQKPVDLQEIRTYSRHPSTRSAQIYSVYGSSKPLAELNLRSANLTRKEMENNGWDWIADVDTRTEPAGERGGQLVSIKRQGDAKFPQILSLVFLTQPTAMNQRNCQTFFSEIDLLDGKVYEPREARRPIVDRLTINDKYQIDFDTTETSELREWVKSKLMPACEEWYPKIIKQLPSKNFEPPVSFTVFFKKDMSGVAYTRGKNVYCARDWYQRNLEGEAVGSVIHELVHVVQQYRRPTQKHATKPGWLVEGIADHIRWYQFEPIENRRRIDFERAQYDAGYFPSATLLNYVVENYDKDVIAKLNVVLREGRYQEELWLKWFDKSPQELWQECNSHEE